MRFLNARLKQIGLGAKRELHLVCTGNPQQGAHEAALLLVIWISPRETELATGPIHVSSRLLINLGERDDYLIGHAFQTTRQPREVLQMAFDWRLGGKYDRIISPDKIPCSV